MAAWRGAMRGWLTILALLASGLASAAAAGPLADRRRGGARPRAARPHRLRLHRVRLGRRRRAAGRHRGGGEGPRLGGGQADLARLRQCPRRAVPDHRLDPRPRGRRDHLRRTRRSWPSSASAARSPPRRRASRARWRSSTPTRTCWPRRPARWPARSPSSPSRCPGPAKADGYGRLNPARRAGPSEAARRGAIAYLLRSLATGMSREPHTGALNYQKARRRSLPRRSPPSTPS